MVEVPTFSLDSVANVVPEIVDESGHTVSLRVFYHDITSLMFPLQVLGAHSQCYCVGPVKARPRRCIFQERPERI